MEKAIPAALLLKELDAEKKLEKAEARIKIPGSRKRVARKARGTGEGGEEPDYEDYLLLKSIYEVHRGKIGYRTFYMALAELLETANELQEHSASHAQTQASCQNSMSESL